MLFVGRHVTAPEGRDPRPRTGWEAAYGNATLRVHHRRDDDHRGRGEGRSRGVPALLGGESPATIGRDLHARHFQTSTGKAWNASRIRDLLGSHHVAGIRMFRGEEAGTGNWPVIIDRGQWDEVQQRRSYRAKDTAEKTKPRRYYLLRGVVMCTCGMRMSGSLGHGGYLYRCSRRKRNDSKRCDRTISAAQVERFARDVAVGVLSKLDTTGWTPVATTRPQADIEADEKDQRKLDELNQMWLSEDGALSTSEYQAMRATITKRMKERQRKTVRRPIAVLEGIAGPDAEENWKQLERMEDYARMNAIFRFLFAAVVIHPTTTRGRAFDPDRMEIKPNDLD